ASELPVMRGEHKPAKSSQYPEAWEWTHDIKTNKREFFNKITGRENNKGEDNSKGKDNVTNEEFELCIQYHHILKEIRACSLDDQETINLYIEQSSLNAEAKDLLRQSMEAKFSPGKNASKSTSVEQEVEAFLRAVERLKPKALRQRRTELEDTRNQLRQKVANSVKEGQKSKSLLYRLDKCL
ncbi:MAG TPA: hypothetical protein VHA52_07620, partial [Candidatus Babeliaceae bacterium]|nr:hypothetical protein [Candidatus Babeliaceae bacterium]